MNGTIFPDMFWQTPIYVLHDIDYNGEFTSFPLTET
jgi:hypothetical protein